MKFKNQKNKPNGYLIEGVASLLIELEGKYEKNTKDGGSMHNLCYASWLFEDFGGF